MGTEVNAQEVLLGRGKLYLDRLTSAFAKTGERFIGNVMLFEVTPTTETIEKFSSATAAAPLIRRDPVRTSLEVRITGDHFSKENLALFFLGDTSTLSQTGNSIAAEVIASVLADRWYPTLYRDITNVVVTGPSQTPTYDLTDDYLVDAKEGRIYIVPGGGITPETDIEVDYDYATIALDTVRGLTSSSIKCYARFVGDPGAGPTDTVEIWRISVAADGAISLIGDDYAEWSITGAVENDATNHPTEPYFRWLRVTA